MLKLLSGFCSTSLSIFAGIAVLLPASFSAIAQPKWITVHEGTDFSVTVSPNHQTIIMDLQGLLWSLPIGGGKAPKRRTQAGRQWEISSPSSPTPAGHSTSGL
jgi:hypothetical protein